MSFLSGLCRDTFDLHEVKVDERGEDLAPHRGRHASQTPSQRLQGGANMSFIALIAAEEALQLLKVEWYKTDAELLCFSFLGSSHCSSLITAQK